MKVKRILITGVGGAPATNFLRSLRQSKEKFYIVGTDSNKYSLARSEADKSYLVPEASNGKYIDFLNFIIKKHNLDFLHVQNDTELQIISENREKINANLFLPSKETIRCCADKFESYKRWQKAGIKVPTTILINTQKDLKRAFNLFNGKVWLRETSGAGGRGSIKPIDIKQAITWIEFKNGWGRFTAAEVLSPDSVTWMSIWYKGKLIVAQTRKRLYWNLSKISPSGVTGVTGAGQTASSEIIDRISIKTIKAIDNNPHGIFSVDLTYNSSSFPNPTEINAGRFFTTHEFFTRAGLNMPYIYLKLAYGEKPPSVRKKLNPLKNNLIWIREIDFLPVLTKRTSIDLFNRDMQKILKKI